MPPDDDKRGEEKRTTASRRFCGGGDVDVRGVTTTDDGRKGAGEVEHDEFALTKLGGGMTETVLAILMAGITASHLRKHPRELQRRQQRRRR